MLTIDPTSAIPYKLLSIGRNYVQQTPQKNIIIINDCFESFIDY